MEKAVFRNKEYKSLWQLFHANKKESPFRGYTTLMKRIKEGMTVEEAFKEGKRKTLISRLGSHIVEGVKYINLPSIAKEYGMSLNTIYKRYSRGHRNDNLVPPTKHKSYVAPKKENKYKFFVKGVGYKSRQEACRKHNVLYITFRKRIASGCTLAQALGIDKRIDKRKENSGPKGKKRFGDKKRHGGIQLSLKGKNYNSIVALAKDYNKSYTTIYRRITKLGFTPEEAIKTEKISGKKIVVDGKTYATVSAAAKAYNLSAETVQVRLRDLGHTPDQAVGREIVKTKHSFEYKGTVYRDLPDLAKKLNLSKQLLKHRIHSGMKISEAIKLGNKKIISEGRYNEKILNRNPKLASKTAFLYFVSIIINGKKRYKLGITTLRVKDRLKQEPHKYKVIKRVRSTLIKCYLIERQLLEKFSKFRDKSIKSEQLDGYSEVFDFPQDEVNKMINDIKTQKTFL